MTKYFYERSQYNSFESQITYHEILQKTDEEFVEWSRLVRKEVIDQWDGKGIPPVVGKDEDGIIESFKKLRSNPCDFHIDDPSDDESLGIIRNFNKDASSVNQFFPTMLKTRISVGKSPDGATSIYDHFVKDELEDKFIKAMKRSIFSDSMYSFSRSLVKDPKQNPFWNGQGAVEFVKEVSKGNIFTGKYSNCHIWLDQYKELDPENYEFESNGESKRLYLTADEVTDLIDNGYLKRHEVHTKGDEIIDREVLKSGKVRSYHYLIRWYEKDQPIFPKIHQVFRLGLGQPAVNFPPLTAKWIYENYTSHIQQDEPLHIYDPSAGWGGRILGAMSSRKNIHYIGTDPNTDNMIPELGISRYQYVADFYNDRCLTDFSDEFLKFFEPSVEPNTYHIFQDGSELIKDNKDFQQYKGKLDLVFTSPPYFNREQYSEDESQSFKAYGQYDEWRTNFLIPTLTTAFNYLKPDRYILWNIASIKIGSDTYFDLEGDSIEALTKLGCEYKGKLKMLMTRMIGLNPDSDGVKNSVEYGGKWYKYEPILVFYKPKH